MLGGKGPYLLVTQINYRNGSHCLSREMVEVVDKLDLQNTHMATMILDMGAETILKNRNSGMVDAAALIKAYTNRYV